MQPLKEELADAIELLFEKNVGSVDSFQTVWDAFNVYIRGIDISKHAGVLKSIRNRLALLEQKLVSLEQTLLSGPNEAITQELKRTLEEYHAEADAEIKHMGKYATARVYGEGERPGAVLAQLLKQHRDKSVVSEITTDTRNTDDRDGCCGAIPTILLRVICHVWWRYRRTYPGLSDPY